MNLEQINIQHVGKCFSTSDCEIIALRDIDLTIGQGEFVSLLGSSGCGKSTLLNAIAGFSLPTSGSIKVGGVEVKTPGPDRGMVFQEYALFPWMTVAQNIAFGLEIKGESKTMIASKVDALLETLSLKNFRNRFPKDLSGGMRQRVAIARVIALDPPILLMDEPFGALDALTRRTLQDELLHIWMELKKTVIFVTRSVDEAIYLSDRIIVMTYRPGTIRRDEYVTLLRPRDPSSKEFNALKRELGQLVMEEQQRQVSAEMHLATSD